MAETTSSCYLPLLASYSISDAIITLAIFYVLFVLFLVAAYYITIVSVVQNILINYGDIALPYFLIGLGVYILSDSILFDL